jgi:2-polyprenyl-6-methoxyphenol hydroxylase-like FAD-dependent oxidoreductase
VTGDGWQEKAHVVVGADGRGSSVARHVRAETTFDAGALRCTFHAYWENVAPLPAPALELWHEGGHLLQVGPCDGARWVIMLSAAVEEFDELRGGRDRAYERRLHAIPSMDTRLRSARRVSPVFGSGRLRNFTRQPAGPGWRLAGDAYCHKDPLFGAGIADSCAAAQELADTLPLAVTGDLDWAEAEQRYATAVDARVGQRMRAGLDGLRVEPPDPGQLAWIRATLAHPAFALELTRHCSTLFSGLPPERRAFWQQAADSAATVLGLPSAARIEAPERAAGGER